MEMYTLKKFRNFFFERSNVRAQVSVEVLAGVIILLLLLVLVFALNIGRDANTGILEKKINAEVECNKIASILSGVNTGKGNTEVVFTANEDFTVKENVIELEDWECNFYGNVSETDLVKGEVKVLKNSSGLVVSNV